MTNPAQEETVPSPAEPSAPVAAPGAWSPFRHPIFLSLWIAALASNLGTWMQEVGDAWLMTSLSSAPLMVALLQTAGSLPVFLLALPAGALADAVDRRRLLIGTQLAMAIAAGSLGVLTLLDLTTSWLLLTYVCLLGIGTAFNLPAWQAVVSELVPRSELPAAIALNSVGFNIARAVGPALGGLVVAWIGSGAAFLLNAISFLGVIAVLYRWPRPHHASVLPAERMAGAVRAGVRYVRHAPSLRALLIRTAIFIACGSALWSILPILARVELGIDALGYGGLLGCLGAGAVLGACSLPRFRQRFSPNILAAAGTITFAAVTLTLAYVRDYWVLCVAMAVGGVAWIALMAGLNVAVQTVLPSWVRARGLAIYLLVFQGGMAAGSLVWGTLAQQAGIPVALATAAAGLVIGLAVTVRYRFPPCEDLDLSPSLHWPQPLIVIEPELERGPVLVTIEYRIDPQRTKEFAQALEDLRFIRRRDGAFYWGLYQDMAEPSRYVETFMVESWAEHLRQHERITVTDRAIQERAQSFHCLPEPPVVSHLLAHSEPRALQSGK